MVEALAFVTKDLQFHFLFSFFRSLSSLLAWTKEVTQQQHRQQQLWQEPLPPMPLLLEF
jgi:hypothetical protein